jgi:uncharacterized membrane protein HdeD (DUF308 family)
MIRARIELLPLFATGPLTLICGGASGFNSFFTTGFLTILLAVYFTIESASVVQYSFRNRKRLS